MGTILKGIQSVLIALGIIAVVGTGAVLYYNKVKPESEIAAAEAEEASADQQTAAENTAAPPEASPDEGSTETAGDDSQTPQSSTASYIEGHEHTYKSTVIKPSTCTEPGEVKYTCYCGDTYVDAIKVKEHTKGHWVTVRAATSTQTGLRQKSCTVCGKVLEEETIPMLAATATTTSSSSSKKKTTDHTHTYTYEITDEATCTEKGTKTYTCSICGSTFETSIPATNHPSRRTVRTEGSCANPGTIETICNICDAVISSEAIYYSHDWGSWEVTTAATSSSKGVKQRVCKDCGKIETKSTNATVVTYTGSGSNSGSTSGSTSTDGTISGGSTTCSHNFTSRVTVNATCTSAGTTVQTCSLCGATTTTAEPAALGHIFSTWKISKAATTTETGERQRFCTRCGYSETETIPMLTDVHKHTWNEIEDIIKEPTCERSGTELHTCTTCGYSYTSTIAPTGHSYDSTDKCTKCGATRS